MDMMSIRRRVMLSMGNQKGRYIDVTVATANPVEFAEKYLSDCNKPNRLYNIAVFSFAQTAVNNQLLTLTIITDGNGEPITFGTAVGLRYRNSSVTGYNFLTSYEVCASIGDKYYLTESDIINF